MRRHQRHPGLAALVALVLAIVFAVAMARGQPVQPTIPLPANAQTNCNPHGQRYALRREVPFTPGNVVTARQRYGPCFGAASDECRDLAGACITTEPERQSTIAWWVYKQAGCASAMMAELGFTRGQRMQQPGITFPSEQDIEDAGVVLGVAAKLKGEYEQACFARPTPAPTPTSPPPQPTPTATPPRPEPTPTVEPTPCATPSPPAECEDCPRFDKLAVPQKHARTLEFAGTWSADNEAKLRDRFVRMQAFVVWAAAQLDKLYVPGVRTSANISQTIEPFTANDSMADLTPASRRAMSAPMLRCSH